MGALERRPIGTRVGSQFAIQQCRIAMGAAQQFAGTVDGPSGIGILGGRQPDVLRRSARLRLPGGQ